MNPGQEKEFCNNCSRVSDVLERYKVALITIKYILGPNTPPHLGVWTGYWESAIRTVRKALGEE